MKAMVYIRTCLLILAASVVSNAHAAAIVTFDFDQADLTTPNGFLDSIPLSSTFGGVQVVNQNFIDIQTLVPDTQTPGFARFGPNDGITFSGGVLLDNPTFTAGIEFASGSILYGTAFAPNSGVTPTDAVPPASLGLNSPMITIDITPAEAVTTVEGVLISGLATDGFLPGAPDEGELADYVVEFFNGTTSLGAIDIPNLEPNSQPGSSAVFRFDSMGTAITQVIFSTTPLIFDMEVGGEWDFFIDTIAFNTPIENVPVPAALPLFFSALLGGWVFARPRRAERI